MSDHTSKKNYWQSIEEITNKVDFLRKNEKEFPEYLPLQKKEDQAYTSRRDFLKLMGFSIAAVSLAACETPVKKAIPYLNKPEGIDPGIPNYYASTFSDGTDFCPIVVKTREGRPIFIEGNTFSSITRGKTNARIQASVMALYDNEKAKNPTKRGKKIDWKTLDSEIKSALESISSKRGEIRIVTNTIASPSTKQIIRDFIKKYPTTQHISYDPESAYGILSANKRLFQKFIIPSYDFEKAKVIVSIGSDFLGNWLSSMEYTSQYALGRKVGEEKKDMSQHFQFESILSLTGANADYRTPIKPSQEGLVVTHLYNLVASKLNKDLLATPQINITHLDRAAKALSDNRKKAVVIAGTNDMYVQMVVNRLNYLLGAYDKIIDLSTPDYQRQGDDEKMQNFIKELQDEKIDAVIFYNSNPMYNYLLGEDITAGIKKVKLSIATSERLDETASECLYHTPDSHFLESWGDTEIKKGYFSLMQPTISNIFSTRQVQESLLKWTGENISVYNYVKSFWKERIFPLQNKKKLFKDFWIKSLHDGVVEIPVPIGQETIYDIQRSQEESISNLDWTEVATKISQSYSISNKKSIELVLYSNSIMGNGNQANNPILQETPDPISKVCWGNFLSISPQLAQTFGFSAFETQTDVATISIKDKNFDIPVLIQPGQEKNTLAIALGYGRDSKAGKIAIQAGGVNAFSLLSIKSNRLSYSLTSDVKISKSKKKSSLAQTQTHHTIMDRKTIIQETHLAEYQKNRQAGRFLPKVSTYYGKRKPNDISIWDVRSDGYKKADKSTKNKKTDTWKDIIGLKADQYEYPQHHWGMAIDLNTCTGCSACIVACTLENNVPVVGKQEVINRREMHWLRIDRYYSNPEGVTSKNTHYKKLEEPAENPEVVFQPMMCQHCNNAPCETVCPVAATTHSSEGLNQMTYNRCVGTKYCANNCPYKVRRFNWFKYHNNNDFDYHMNNALGKMVLNPDVTVRSRGVMEKCSMCIQRIQAGKLKAKMEKRNMIDGDASTACAKACPHESILFGDLNDKNSKVRKLLESELKGRAYNVLEEINTNPNIWYLTKVRNKG